MGGVVAIGRAGEIAGFALAGVELCPVDDDETARRAWASLDTDVRLVIVTAAVAQILEGQATATQLESSGPLWVVMPP